MLTQAITLIAMLPVLAFAADEHNHPAPEKLGTVSFPISCKPEVQQPFNRAVALLHSFAYKAAEDAFHTVAEQDPQCAIAHWGIAMTHFHQLWDLPPLPLRDSAAAQQDLGAGCQLEASERERGFIHALSLVFNDPVHVPYSTRARTTRPRCMTSQQQIPRTLRPRSSTRSRLSRTRSPSDKEHRKQKQAAGLLEPHFHEYPDHPGIPHYLIHACDSQELASRGFPQPAPMQALLPRLRTLCTCHPTSSRGLGFGTTRSHPTSPQEMRRSQQGDTGEELHAMDYLVYAYLQSGRDQEAPQVIQQLKAMPNLHAGDFKIGTLQPPCPFATSSNGINGTMRRKLSIRPRQLNRMLSQLRRGHGGWDSLATSNRRMPRKKPRHWGASKISFARPEITTGQPRSIS